MEWIATHDYNQVSYVLQLNILVGAIWDYETRRYSDENNHTPQSTIRDNDVHENNYLSWIIIKHYDENNYLS